MNLCFLLYKEYSFVFHSFKYLLIFFFNVEEAQSMTYVELLLNFYFKNTQKNMEIS